MTEHLLDDTAVFVTGAAGFIGSHLVERLLSEGASVRALVRYNSRNDAGWLRDVRHPHLEVVPGDLLDPHVLEGCLEGRAVCFHLGAVIPIPYSYVAPRHVVETNVLGTLNLLQASRAQRVGRFIHTSTSEVYGSPESTPIPETARLRAQSPYAASKVAADKLVESFHLSYGFPTVTVRPFNTYGPRQSLRAVLPTIIVQALTADRIELGSLWPTRDLTFVSDTVDGFIRAATAADVDGQTFNLGTGTDASVGALVESVLAALGVEKEVLVRDERVRPEGSEVVQLVSDNSLSRERLGWTPQVELKQGLARTIEWFRAHLSDYPDEGYVL